MSGVTASVILANLYLSSWVFEPYRIHTGEWMSNFLQKKLSLITFIYHKEPRLFYMNSSRSVPSLSPTLIDLHQKLADLSLFMRRKLRDHFGHKNISFNQYRILRVLKENPDFSLSSLDEQITMKKGNLSRLVDGMVRQNMINRERDTSSDRRKISLSLTQKGGKILEELEKKQEELIKMLYQSVPEGEVEIIHHNIARLLYYIQQSAT